MLCIITKAYFKVYALSDKLYFFLCVDRTERLEEAQRKRRRKWKCWKKAERNLDVDEALSEKCISVETGTKSNFCVLWVRILRARVNRSVWRPAAARALLSFMEVISLAAWREANKCLETKEEFDLNTRGSPLKAGHWLLHYARSLPCLRSHSSPLQRGTSFSILPVSRSCPVSKLTSQVI
jgi:hypothetical protein